MTRSLFVSYARKDRDVLQPVLDGIERLDFAVWVDRKLEGGQSWWDEILSQVRGCDAVLVSVSSALLDSEACTAERGYARNLGKPIVPVLIRPVPMQRLPRDLAMLQIVDYTAPGVEAAFELAGALSNLRPPPELPDPLPPPPEIPKSYQYDLADRVNAPTLSLDEQLTLVAQLRGFVARPDDRDWAMALLLGMQARRDLYRDPDREITEILTRVEGGSANANVEAPPTEKKAPAGVPPRGWYDDPSRRHQLRWFDRDWTRWASDGGVVVDDPDF